MTAAPAVTASTEQGMRAYLLQIFRTHQVNERMRLLAYYVQAAGGNVGSVDTRSS